MNLTPLVGRWFLRENEECGIVTADLGGGWLLLKFECWKKDAGVWAPKGEQTPDMLMHVEKMAKAEFHETREACLANATKRVNRPNRT